MSNKIIRSVCYFAKDPNKETIKSLGEVVEKLIGAGFEIQTKRVCSPDLKIVQLDRELAGEDFIFSVGTLSQEEAKNNLEKLINTKDTSFNIDFSKGEITENSIKILFEIIKEKPEKTFNFTFVFNNADSTPFFPSANYKKDGFSIGLQPTDLAENCKTLEEWLKEMKRVWDELETLFKDEPDFLGIDSSVAPLFSGKSSFINFIKKIGNDFSESTTTDVYTQITKFLIDQNPKPVGLCGLMFPTLEDFDLADEYESGNFSIERNIYLSLHSGLGIDTYPIGIDESPKRIAEILSLVQALSNKYKKPLSARFVSDGKTKIGDKSDFKNQYLKDVKIRSL